MLNNTYKIKNESRISLNNLIFAEHSKNKCKNNKMRSNLTFNNQI